MEPTILENTINHVEPDFLPAVVEDWQLAAPSRVRLVSESVEAGCKRFALVYQPLPSGLLFTHDARYTLD